MKDIPITQTRTNKELYHGEIQNIIENSQALPTNYKYLLYF